MKVAIVGPTHPFRGGIAHHTMGGKIVVEAKP